MPLTALSNQIAEMGRLIHRLFALVKVLIVMLVVIFAVVIVLEIQVARRNTQIDKLQTAAQEAKESSDASYTLLDSAITSSRENAPDTAKAVDQIAQIRAAVAEILVRLGGTPLPQ